MVRCSRISLLGVPLSALLVLSACGGGSNLPTTPGTTPPPPTTTATPQPTPTPTPTPEPTPTATPFDCNRDTLAPGPVVTYRFKLKVIRRNGNVIEGPPEGDEFPTDGHGRIIVHEGDFLVFDSTQKNANGRPCQWENDPGWWTSDESILSERTEASRQTTSCGFLLRADVIGTGEFEVDAWLDGVDAETVYGHDPVLRLVAE
jgi:hypothetical protein